MGKAHTVEGSRAEASRVAQLVKNLPTTQKALGREDPLEKA